MHEHAGLDTVVTRPCRAPICVPRGGRAVGRVVLEEAPPPPATRNLGKLEAALRARVRQLDALIAQSLERSGFALMGPAIRASADAKALDTALP